MKKILKKLLICICLFLILFNFMMAESNYVYAGIANNIKSVFAADKMDVGDVVVSLLSGIVGLLTWTIRLPIAITPLILETVTGAIAQMDGTIGGGFVLLTPYEILFNKIHLTSINFFDLTNPGTGTATNTIRTQVAMWYYIMRTIAVAILLGILIFVGIRMAITTVASEKAIYKKALFDWATSLALVFLLHYIIRAILWINTSLVEMLESVAATNTGLANLLKELAGLVFDIDLLTAVPAIVIYLMITIQTLMFLINYIKRALTLAFLIIISPLITITYSIDKMGDQKAQALNTWLKEFSYTVLIQPFHCILYLVFADTAMKIISSATGSKAIAAAVLSIFCIKFVWDGEKIVRKIFGFEQGSSFASAAASGAVIGSMVGKAQSLGKGAASGIKFAKNSKMGQAAKNSKLGQKIQQKKTNSINNQRAKAMSKMGGFGGRTYDQLSDAEKQQVDKKTLHGKAQSAGNFARKVGKSKAVRDIGKATAAVAVASAMYALPDTNAFGAITGGYIAGKSAGSGIKKLQENKKEHFEEKIMKAWNTHCEITGQSKNSKEQFNEWYEKTYESGKQKDEYSQKNMSKEEGSARTKLQEDANVRKEDLSDIITKLQRAILTNEPYDPSKLFSGYQAADGSGTIDPAVIAAAVAAYAGKYNESCAYKKASDYNDQMNQFGVTAQDAVDGITDAEFQEQFGMAAPVQPETPVTTTEETVVEQESHSEQFESEQLEMVSNDLNEAQEAFGGAEDIPTLLAGLQGIIEGKINDLESTIKTDINNIGNDQDQKIDQVMNEIKTDVSNISPDAGNLESQINNIVSNAMSKIDFRGASEEQRTQVQSNLREYTNKQVANNYVTNNYGSINANSNINLDKLREDLTKIANTNK